MQRNVLEYLEQAAGKNPDKIIFGEGGAFKPGVYEPGKESGHGAGREASWAEKKACGCSVRQNHPASDRLFRSCLQWEFLCAD